MSANPPLPLLEPAGAPPRFSKGTLPPYRHVPGLTPHPVRHPEGHLYGAEEAVPSQPCRELPDAWRFCREYLLGIDLFNQSYLWEAHEVWELVWIGAGKRSDPALFVQSLIQISAATLRSHLGTPRGAENLAAKAWQRLDQMESRAGASRPWIYMGIAVEPWRRSVERYLTSKRTPFPFLIPEL